MTSPIRARPAKAAQMTPGGSNTDDGDANEAESLSGDSLLGVDRSLSGKQWILKDVDGREALALSQRLGVPEVVGRMMAARGIPLDDADNFLNPTLKALLPDPGHLIGMSDASQRLAAAIMNDEMIGVFGDYDVDGATSSALLMRFFTESGGRCRVYIPDRIEEGYGPNAPALAKLQDEGAAVVVTVDCGTTSFEPLAIAAKAGLEVIVVDHHEAEAKLPDALAVINPNRLDENSPHGQMAAVGVTFLLVVGVNRALRDAGWYAGERREPDLRQWLDLVALGTVCDVVPLTGVNRAFVTQGLKVMAGRGNTGLKALADVAGIDEAPGTYHAGFVLGPRINAGGRVGKSDLGTRLLSTHDQNEARDISRQLHEFNSERREIEAVVLEQAFEQIEARGGPAGSLAWVAGEGWHPGVIGIVASRLKERYNRPAVVIALDDKRGLGSGRSVSGVDLGAAIIAARQAGLLISGGGHSMAAGLTVAPDGLDAAFEFISGRIEESIGDGGLRPRLTVDGVIKATAATVDLIETLQQLGPFGAGNPEPRFAIANARLTYSDIVGNDHVRCAITGDEGGKLNAISFRSVDSPLGQALLNHGGRPMNIVGKLRLNAWQGRTTAQMHIEDAVGLW